MNNGIRLTPRDVNILRDIYDNTFLTFSQITARHFPSVARVTVQNRLTQIMKAGFLNRMRVGSVVYHAEPIVIGVVYTMTRLGLKEVQKFFPEVPIRNEPVLLDTGSLCHDLELISVMDSLKLRIPQVTWVNSKNVLGAATREMRRPDIIGQVPSSQVRLAIELDLTVKSERAYRDIVNQYVLSREYALVLYVTGSRAIDDKIKELVTGIKGHLRNGSMPTGKFYFTSLPDLAETPMTALMTNGRADFGTEIMKFLASQSLAS